MKLHSTLLISLFCFAGLPAQADDKAAAPAAAPAATSAAAPAAAAAAAPAEAKKAARKPRTVEEIKSECDQLARGKSGTERKKLIRDCMHGKMTESLPQAAKSTEAAPTADKGKAPEGDKSTADAAKAKQATPKHKDEFPAERVNKNPRLLERSCLKDANEQHLTGQDRINYLKDCVKTATPLPSTFTGK